MGFASSKKADEQSGRGRWVSTRQQVSTTVGVPSCSSRRTEMHYDVAPQKNSDILYTRTLHAMAARHQEGRYETTTVSSRMFCLQRTIYRRMTSVWQGTPQVRNVGRELVLETGDFVKKKRWRGYCHRRTTQSASKKRTFGTHSTCALRSAACCDLCY